MTQETATIGHNQPPLFDPDIFKELQEKAEKHNEAGKLWLKIDKIKDDDQAKKFNDYLSAGRAIKKEIEDKRKDAKQPHIDAGKKVDSTFNPLKDGIDLTAKRLDPLRTEFLQRKQEELERKQKEEQERLRKEREKLEAERKKAEEEADAAAIAAAEKGAKKLDKTIKSVEKPVAAQMGSDAGGRNVGLKSRKTFKVTNINQALVYFRANQELIDLVIKLARAELQSGVASVPGITVTTEKV